MPAIWVRSTDRACYILDVKTWLYIRDSVSLCLSEETLKAVDSTPAWHAGDLGSIPGPGMLYYRYKNLALNISYCVSLCLSEDTLKAVDPFYLVSMPGEVKNSMCILSWPPHCSLEKDNSLNHSCVSPSMGCLDYI